ncbi:hypothetical protein HY087_01840 [Candidatus Gottesmanbacteria bacterium]|nr:hypothetical protein [Candidatus Gottesmanbacteria bacterium]
MRRFLPLLLLLVVAVPLLILLNARFGWILKKNLGGVKYPSKPIASSVSQMITEDPTNVLNRENPIGASLTRPTDHPEAKTRTVRGNYKSFQNGIVTIDTVGSTIDVRVGNDIYAVCTPRYWTNADGKRFDLRQVWFDTSAITLTNYRGTAKNETEADFGKEQVAFTTDTHLIMFTLESPVDKTLFAKKVWILGCNP